MTLVTLKLGKQYNEETIYIALDERQHWDESPLFYPYEIRLLMMEDTPEEVLTIIEAKKRFGGFLQGPGGTVFKPPKKGWKKKPTTKGSSVIQDMVSKRNLKLKKRT